MKATTFFCGDCKKENPVENAVLCEICNREDSDSDSDSKKKLIIQQIFYCKRCTHKCFVCKATGCDKCVDTVCCDCGVSMCDECRSGDNLCGCYGKCYLCRRDINRGSEGWPCYDCKKWYCGDCRYNDNPCKECGPDEEEEK